VSDNPYVIRGGVEGRERLRLLARIMRPTTLRLFDLAGIRPGMACLDVGCGGGDGAVELARLVGAGGRVVAIDTDPVKLDLARTEAAAQGLGNVEFRQADVSGADFGRDFDVVYARFLLTHLSDPAAALAAMRRALRPGGLLVVEDIDFAGHFCDPDSVPFRRYVELYTAVVRRHGGDPNIGPRLPRLLMDAGCEGVRMNVVQPAATDGEVKLVNAVTMENIAESVVAAGLASAPEVAALAGELYAYARDPRTVMSIARVVQAWGRAPAHA